MNVFHRFYEDTTTGVGSMNIGSRNVAQCPPTTLVMTLLLLGVASSVSPASGQPFQPDPVANTTAMVYWAKPFFPDVRDLDPNGSVFGIDVVFPWKAVVSVQIGIPLAIADAATEDGTGIHSGNLHVSALFGDLGALKGFVRVTLPTASNPDGSRFPPGFGAFWAWDEPEVWSTDGLGLSGAVTPSWPVSGGGRLGVRLGGNAARTETDGLILFGRAAGWGRFPLGSAELRADLSSSFLLNDDEDFGRHFTAYFTLGAEYSEIPASPGLFIRVPLDGEARRYLDFAAGLSARF